MKRDKLRVSLTIPQPHLSFSATKMTRRSSSSEAKTRMTWRTLRQLNRLSKSTCSSLESLGRLSSMTWSTTTEKNDLTYFRQNSWEGQGSSRVWKVFLVVSSSDLISCTRQKGLDFDKLPWCREGWFHETPHEGVDQSCRDASPPLYLIQYLGTTVQSQCILNSWNINMHFVESWV